MLTGTRKGVVSKSRRAWGREGGARKRHSTARVRRALNLRRRQGWIAAMPVNGPRYERLTVLRFTHPLAMLAGDYGRGVRWFDRQRLERTLGCPLNTRSGADLLAAAGFALLRGNGAMVQLRAADPRVARYVNRARLGRQRRRYKVCNVLEAFLSLPSKRKRRRSVTEDRRLDAAEVLHNEWLIDAEELLNCGPLVRLHTRWVLPGSRPLAASALLCRPTACGYALP